MSKFDEMVSLYEGEFKSLKVSFDADLLRAQQKVVDQLSTFLMLQSFFFW